MTMYADRYVAFVDILGFRELVKEIERGKLPPEYVRDVLAVVHEDETYSREAWKYADFRAISVSDAVALSCAPDPGGLDLLFYSICRLTAALLLRGYFIRGAVVRGKLWHDNTTVFGPALVQAYDIETKVARYPRIVVTRDVFLDVQQSIKDISVGVGKHLDGMLKQADDGPMYLHVLRHLIRELVKLQDRAARFPEFQQEPLYQETLLMRNHIQQAFDRSIDDPGIFEKVQWFARYWNQVVHSNLRSIQPLTGPVFPTLFSERKRMTDTANACRQICWWAPQVLLRSPVRRHTLLAKAGASR